MTDICRFPERQKRPGLLHRTSAKRYRGLLRIFDKYLKLKGLSEMDNDHFKTK